MALRDLDPAVLAPLLGDRPFRSYPAMLSTEADACAWARAAGPAGAVVVADYQASARGRGGMEWQTQPGTGLGFSLVLRPDWPPASEGFVYPAAVMGLLDVIGGRATTTWPDEVHRDAQRVAAVGAYVELGPARIEWAVVTVLVEDAGPPRGALLVDALTAIERRAVQDAETVLDEYRPTCATLGQNVRARLIPLGPSGPQVKGTAEDVDRDGSLVIAVAPGRRMRVPPRLLGRLEPADAG